MKRYNPKAIEGKWQKYWQAHKTFQTRDKTGKKKRFVLVEFPYPSGAGLHMGHMRGYTAGDVTARYWRLRGEEVLFPIGWDAFGLPAENYAIKTGVHPKKSTAKNISNFTKQINALGYSFDWSRKVDTTDPLYYKWTQWIFLQLFKARLAYEAVGPINWCPKDKCGLANEEVVNGACERCGTPVEKQEMRQWFLRITAYAEKLLSGLKHLPEWPEQVKVQQENWIGKSEGAEIEFGIKNSEYRIKVFTTRADTIYGATYLVVAPEHEIISKIKSQKSKLQLQIQNWPDVEGYIARAQKKSEIVRTDNTKEKTGVELKGIVAINPATKEEIPIWVADYVLGSYGTGAIMAVPAHDSRDFEFAKKFNLPIKQVVLPNFVNAGASAPNTAAPTQERENVLCIVKDTSTNKFVLLDWTVNDWVSFIGGGIETGEDFVQAGAREIKEESGYSRVQYIRKVGAYYSHFFNKQKNKNYKTSTHCLYYEVSGTSKLPSATELAKHKLLLLGEAQVRTHLLSKQDSSDVSYLLYHWDKFISGIGHYEGVGILYDSGEFTGQESVTALPLMAKKFGRAVVQYKLRDWLFSRQRYWGEPIPIVHCALCAGRGLKAEGRGLSRTAAEFYFPGNKYWQDILRGTKTVETRSFDPMGVNATWGKLEVGDRVSLFNKKTGQRGFATVVAVRKFKNFLGLYKATDWLAGVFPGQKFKSLVAVELAYKKIYKGYPQQVARFGLWAWRLQIDTMPVAVPEKQLPVRLPGVKKYQPTGTGESPLAQVKSWVEVLCPVCGGPARRETNTMPQWAGSSWYWLRYTDPQNRTTLAGKDKLRRWTPVDVYFGGMEHTTLHLLYSRFWNLFLYDQKLVTSPEPYTQRVPHGIILAADGEKMSKSRGNVVSPDNIVRKFGADAARLYELFLGPHESQVVWHDLGIVGVRRFLDRVWSWGNELGLRAKGVGYGQDSKKVGRAINKLVKKLGDDIENFRFNTCISAMMEFLNAVKDEPISKASYIKFLIVMYPFAPHLAEELHLLAGRRQSLQKAVWPKVDVKLLAEETVEFVVQINGKLKDKLQLPVTATESDAVQAAKSSAKFSAALGTAPVKRVIFVPGRLVNFVI